jgi:hypothetical protein
MPFPSRGQTSLVRESENMVRDTTTRLGQAVGELDDLIVRVTLPPPLSLIPLIVRHGCQ